MSFVNGRYGVTHPVGVSTPDVDAKSYEVGIRIGVGFSFSDVLEFCVGLPTKSKLCFHYYLSEIRDNVKDEGVQKLIWS